jgi:hypothetical protein
VIQIIASASYDKNLGHSNATDHVQSTGCCSFFSFLQILICCIQIWGRRITRCFRLAFTMIWITYFARSYYDLYFIHKTWRSYRYALTNILFSITILSLNHQHYKYKLMGPFFLMWVIHIRHRESKYIESRRHKYLASTCFVMSCRQIYACRYAAYANLSILACHLSKPSFKITYSLHPTRTVRLENLRHITSSGK